MKTKIFTFFVLVFGFCAFADSVSYCLEQKQAALEYISSAQTANDITGSTATQIFGNSTDGFIQGLAYSIYDSKVQVDDNLVKLHSAVSSISCNASNDTCSVDLGPLVAICSNIYDVVSFEYAVLTNCADHLFWIHTHIVDIDSALSPNNVNSIVGDPSSFPDYWVNVKYPDLLSAVSNFNNDVTSSFDVLTNQVANLHYTVDTFYNSPSGGFSDLLSSIQSIVTNLDMIRDYDYQIFRNLFLLSQQISNYLPYVKTISDDLKSLVTNGTFQADYDFTNQLYSSSLLGFDRFRYYAQGQSNNNQLQLYPLSPYDTASNLRNATIYDALSSGFASLLISQGSINNYLYWLKAIAGSNRLEAVEAHLVAVSNLVGRLDDYVLGDFSNEVSRLVETLSYVTNRVDYTTNLVEIVSLLQSSSNHLASIDSKLDVLDYIKILSDTPLSDYGGDVDYFDYLTNLYLSGASSSGVSTNWFERIEILLASLVFGDSDGTNGIPQSVEMQGFDSDAVSGAMSDFAFSEDFSTSVDNLSETSRNFMQVLNDYHSAIKNVSLPASVSIGLFGMDTGGDTTSYEQLLDHSFQVSFDVGSADRFTVVVRAVTTMSWVLLTMIFIWHCGFWILQKIQFFYRLMRLLINSIWLKS
ncbi:MAG: hypothetical protein II823_05930 [Kiritimatiellae bacterium]|nr:hypothetical protein [Kiritimatiellia bacterium]